MKKLLGREPTPEMVAVFGTESVVSFWKKMWDAAPALPEAGGVERNLRLLMRGLDDGTAQWMEKAADLIAALRERAEKAEAERDAAHESFSQQVRINVELAAECERLREENKMLINTLNIERGKP